MKYPARYDRNKTALSDWECELLAEKRIAIIGCGGLGGLVIEALARIGVGHLRVIDGDVFEQSNLNRQLLCTEEALGREKAAVAAERIRANALNAAAESDTKKVCARFEGTVAYLSDTVRNVCGNKHVRSLKRIVRDAANPPKFDIQFYTAGFNYIPVVI